MPKLKQKEIADVRDKYLDDQGGICPICGMVIEEDPVLDHDHSTGHVRSTLHRECNSIEGKFANWFKSFGKGKDPETVLLGIIQYWKKDYTNNPLHPKHLTDKDKELRKLRRRLKLAKRKETKERLRNEIKELRKNL